MKRYNITIDDELAEKMDEFMARFHTNRSNLISIAVSQYMDAVDAVPALKLQLKELETALESLAIEKK